MVLYFKILEHRILGDWVLYDQVSIWLQRLYTPRHYVVQRVYTQRRSIYLFTYCFSVSIPCCVLITCCGTHVMNLSIWPVSHPGILLPLRFMTDTMIVITTVSVVMIPYEPVNERLSGLTIFRVSPRTSLVLNLTSKTYHSHHTLDVVTSCDFQSVHSDLCVCSSGAIG